MASNNKIISTEYDFTDLKLYFEKFKKKQESDYENNNQFSIEVSYNPLVELLKSFLKNGILILIGIISVLIISKSNELISNVHLKSYLLFFASLPMLFGTFKLFLSTFIILLKTPNSFITKNKRYTSNEYYLNNFEKYLKELSSYFKTNITENNIIKNDKGLIIEPNLSTNKDKYFWNKVNKEKEVKND